MTRDETSLGEEVANEDDDPNRRMSDATREMIIDSSKIAVPPDLGLGNGQIAKFFLKTMKWISNPKSIIDSRIISGFHFYYVLVL